MSALQQFEPLLSDEVGSRLALPKLIGAHLWEGFFPTSEQFNSFTIPPFDEILPPALPDRKGISMARRRGQSGWIELRKGTYYARFWIDVPGRSTRACPRVRICPAEGPGTLNASERSRRLKQILVEHGANSEVAARQAVAANLGITFEEQSEKWLQTVQNRKRNPVKPRTAKTWQSHLKYINSKIGPMQLADVNNRAMRDFVAEMASEPFSPKTIENYLAVVKSVVASVRNEKGERIYRVDWNHEYMDVPIIAEQNAPSFTASEIEAIISIAEGQDRVIYALLAGSGLRIGECFALRVEDVRDTVLDVRHASWEGAIFSPKHGKIREVDIHSDLADLLREHIGGRKTGFVFPSDNETPLRKSNLLRRSLHPILAERNLKPRGFHAFRRFRVAHLRKQLVPEILLRIWIGHSTEGITDKYALEGVKRDTMFRTMVAQKAGLGFNLGNLLAGGACESRPIAPTASDVNTLKTWSGREDLNLRPPGPEPGALPG